MRRSDDQFWVGYLMPAGVRRELGDLLRLAVPITLGRIGIVLMTTVDLIMVGHFDSTELAYQSIGVAPVMPLIVIGLGLLTGTAVIVANSRGAGNMAECGLIWRRSVPYAMAIGMIAMTICVFGADILLLTGQTPSLAAGGGEVMRISGYGMPAFMLFLTTAFFLEGVGRAAPWMIVIFAGNVVNVLLNGVLIEGAFGIPAMGAAELYATRGRLWHSWASWRAQRSIGYAASIGGGAESLAFATLTVFAGWLGEHPLAAFAMTFNILTMIFMVTLGVGSATAVRVGVAFGAENHGGVGRAGWLGFGFNSVVMAGFGLILLFGHRDVAALFTADPALIAEVAPMLGILCVILLIDGGQSVLAHALRGRRDVWLPCAIQVSSYFVIMIPAAYYFAFALDYEGRGLMYGFLLASTVAFAFLVARSRRMIGLARAGHAVGNRI